MKRIAIIIFVLVFTVTMLGGCTSSKSQHKATWQEMVDTVYG